MTIRNVLWIVLCFFIVSEASSLASSKPKAPPAPDDRKLVSAVDAAKGTLEITHQSHHVVTKYVFAAGAVILINGKAAAIKDVKVGLQLFSLQLGSGMDDPAIIEELELKNAAPAPK